MSPSEIYQAGPLFEDVQLNHVFNDGKTFVDCTPRIPLAEIRRMYQEQKDQPGFNLKRFVLSHFILPMPHSGRMQGHAGSVEEHLEKVWEALTRQPEETNGSVIPLPYPYIVPGGRFGEIYYWDSYFTMLGLQVSGKYEMIENMVKNFSFLIDKVGHIPNGNRTYYQSRSQPPYYSLMVEMLAGIKGKEVFAEYLPQLEKEYNYWMRGRDKNQSSAQHVIQLPNNIYVNRYWDDQDGPRPESFASDVELARESLQDERQLYRNLRAGAESGWDYSCRWFRDENDFGSIHTTDIMPVDLNCLLVHLELTIADAYILNGDKTSSEKYRALAEQRIEAIDKYCWNESLGFYMDYDFVGQSQKMRFTLASLSPLFFNYSTQQQADKVAELIQNKFLTEGGLVTTLNRTGQQWDAPNGWAPLHWIAIIGLDNYGHDELAATIAKRWMKLNTDVFHRTGKFMEKYNVVDTHLEAGGGEYAGQDGFGWTNGVYLALLHKYSQ